MLLFFTGLIVLIDRLADWSNDDENGYFIMTVLGLGLIIWLWSVCVRFIKRRRRAALKCNDCQTEFTTAITGGGNLMRVTDVVFVTEKEYINAILKWLHDMPGGVVVAWFRNDFEKLIGGALSHENCRLAGELTSSSLGGRPLLFAGHYPLKAAEVTFCDKMGVNSIQVYSHLNMPLLKKIFAEKLEELIANSGLQDNKDMYQVMIAHGISKAQERIADDVTTEIYAQSEEEWMNLNVSGNIF